MGPEPQSQAGMLTRLWWLAMDCTCAEAVTMPINFLRALEPTVLMHQVGDTGAACLASRSLCITWVREASGLREALVSTLAKVDWGPLFKATCT
jgi:hypothetical protein